jgi:hypothetical protein
VFREGKLSGGEHEILGASPSDEAVMKTCYGRVNWSMDPRASGTKSVQTHRGIRGLGWMMSSGENGCSSWRRVAREKGLYDGKSYRGRRVMRPGLQKRLSLSQCLITNLGQRSRTVA